MKPPRQPRKRPGIAEPPSDKLLFVQEIKRLRHRPLTDEEFWEACKTHLPTEMLPLAAAWILEKVEKARQADVDTKAGVGRPPGGVGSHVDELMTGPLKFDQRMARLLVARRLCTCRDGDGFPAECCTCNAYERAKASHNQWRREQRTRKSQGQ